MTGDAQRLAVDKPASRISSTAQDRSQAYGVRYTVEDQIKKLVEELFTTEDLRVVQTLALELQRAVYGRIQQLQMKSVEASSVQPDDQSVFEAGLSSTSLDGIPAQNTDETS